MAVTVSLFSGCGGLDLGAAQAGARIHVAVEPNQDAADSLEANFDESLGGVIRRPIEEVASSDLLSRLPSEPVLLIGGPPCTPFSKSGMWLDWKRAGMDPAARLLDEYVRVLTDLRPAAFVLENVRGLVFNNRQSRPSFDRLLKSLWDAGYSFRWRVLDAADYGVAQKRERLFVIGLRARDAPDFPPPSHGSDRGNNELIKPARPHITSNAALLRVDPFAEADARPT